MRRFVVCGLWLVSVSGLVACGGGLSTEPAGGGDAVISDVAAPTVDVPAPPPDLGDPHDVPMALDVADVPQAPDVPLPVDVPPDLPPLADVPPDTAPDVAPDLLAPDLAADTTVDVAADAAADLAGDGTQPACGEGDDEKVRLAVPGAAWIVNGQDEPDPTVVALTPAQKLAVGALYMYGYDWMTGHNQWSEFCSGTLIANDWVLTAAHCTIDAPSVGNLRFRLGADSATPVAELHVDHLYHNTAYNPYANTANHDVGLVHLSDPLPEGLDVVPLPINEVAPPEGFLNSHVQNVGFGTVDARGRQPNTARWWTVEDVVQVTTYDYKVYGGGVSSVCFGDSGGPSMWTFADGVVRITGVVSWGDPSCVDYDHFVRIDNNLAWIRTYVPAPVTCGDETAVGRCDGDVAMWCDGDPGAIRQQDCAALGWTCGTDGDGNSRCLPGACGELTWDGVCDPDGTARWCDDGVARHRRCPPCHQTCAVADDGLGAYCR